MHTVEQLLREKRPGVVTIGPGATVFEALEKMAEHDIGALVVVDVGVVVGVLSERDYARKVILHNRSSREILVSAIMTRRVVYAGMSQTVEECMALMTDRRIRHLPVVDGGDLVGVLSIGDLVRATIHEQQFTIHEQQFTIRQLERYIAS
jgi:CBS domain-containing protein